MLTNFFIRCGWSRDDLKWLVLQIVAVAGLITSNAFDVPYWCAYLGVPLSPTTLHWIFGVSALVLWMAGRYNSSPLPSAGAMASGAVPGSPSGPPKFVFALLAIGLAGSLSACASARHVLVVADASLASAVFAVDDAELAACQAHVLTVEKCAELNTPIKKALQDVKALTAALQATPTSGTVPGSLADVLKDIQTIRDIVNALGQGPDLKPLIAKVQAADTAAIGQLAKLTGGK